MGYKANIASNLFNQILRLLLGALTSILVARALGPAGQGYVAYIILMFTLLGDNGHMGLNNAVMYFQKRGGGDRQILFHTNLTALGLILAAITALLLILRAGGMALANYSWLYILGGILFVGGDFLLTNHQAWMVGDERIVEANRYILASFLLKSAALLLLWLFKALTPATFFLVSVLAMLLTAVLLHLRLRLRFRPLLDLNLLRSEFAYGSVIWLGAVFCFLHYRVDQFMIKRMLGISELGVYAIAVTLAELLFLIPLSINSALLGRLYNTDTPQAARALLAKTLRLSLWICLLLALLGIPLSLLIPFFYGAAFAGAVLPTMVLLLGVVFASLATVASQYYFSLGKPLYHLIITGATLLLNIGLNFLLIPSRGITGAAIASSASYLAYGLSYIILLSRRDRFLLRELWLPSSADFRDLWRRT